MPAAIFQQALFKFQLVASIETKKEIETVLNRKKFDQWRDFDDRMEWLKIYFENLSIVTPTVFFTNSIDPKDNKFLDVAVAAKASVIVCSDDHLLTLHPFREHGGNIEILTLQKFHEMYLLKK